MEAMRRLLAPAVAAALLLGAQGARAEAAPQVVKLPDEQSVTRWAHPGARAYIRANPSHRSRRISRLRLLTEDGFPEIYIGLRQTTDERGNPWVEIRIPGRPNGRVGWVPRFRLGSWHVLHTQLVVDRRRLRATLYRDGRRIWRSPVGVGKASTPTPGGRFYIRERIKSLGSGGLYGPLAFGTSAYSRLSDWPGGGVIGIHGTDQPELIPGRPSHGCIRVPNRNILRLARLMPLGTPVRIL
jgi:hypothetical protein